ncbi:MAG: envelope integrity protein Cei [Pseudonocardiaceae bacterium]|nr:envelope integrity protein Cei [Pseudonocardiaceae bacterium]
MGPGYVTGRGRAPLYRRRRPLPALIILSILGIGAITVWVNALDTSIDRDEAVKCPAPTHKAADVTFQQLPYDALDRTAPMPASKVQVRVLNAGDQRGQASITTEGLKEFGFEQVAKPTNDSLYPEENLDCRGQIRFGENGAAAARTLSILEPCAELVRDGRPDASVDLTVGVRFDDLRPKTEAVKVLRSLEKWAASHPDQRGGEQAAERMQPDIDPALLSAARDMSC